MTLKWESLEKFVDKLRRKYPAVIELPASILDMEIRKEFGVSDYIVANVKKSLGTTRILVAIDPFKWQLRMDNDGEMDK